ncbi:hypothetical protein EIP86_001971 [Pleurotus ostreatoroseus]|nr:hypothetical protein EIP86_001971 [Pleurotus ostreatoroseus]
MARRIHHSRYSYFDVDIADCPPSPPFSHHTEHTSWDSYPLFTLQDSGPLRKTRSLSPEARHDTTRADDQRLFSGCSKPAHILERSLTPPCRFDSSPMDGSTSPERTASALLPELLPPPHDAFFRPQPPSPPLDTPELVQRSLPALQDPVCPPSCLSLNTQDLPETLDAEMRDVDEAHFARPSTSRLCHSGRPTEDDFSSKRLCLWHSAEAEKDISLPSGSSSSALMSSYPELLTPVTPTSFTWISEPPFPEEPVDSIDDLSFDDYNMSDWAASSSSSSYAPVPNDFKRRSRSLEFPEINGFDPSSSAGPSYHHPLRSYTSPPGLPTCDEDLDSPWSMNIDDATAPRSPRPPSATLPGDTYEHSRYPQDTLPLEVDPPPGTSAPRCRDPLSLPCLFDEDVFISPHSPRAFTTRLPELEMEEDTDMEPPSSPRSPYRELSPIEDDPFTQPATISPSLLVPQTGEGLGLFIQPSSIDPPLARSPSPDEDDMHFLDIQLDPASTSLPVGEFISLRTLRRRALDAEREARSFEAELAERVSTASDALLPSHLYLCDAVEKRARKHELHVATEQRAEARKARKREKQRSKEVGALLDLKMERGVPQGKIRSVPQLVANMLLKRRDVCRPLANRKPAGAAASLVSSPLRVSFAVEDLMEDDDAFSNI